MNAASKFISSQAILFWYWTDTIFRFIAKGLFRKKKTIPTFELNLAKSKSPYSLNFQIFVSKNRLIFITTAKKEIQEKGF